jgi:predicted dienelactone hydrolase
MWNRTCPGRMFAGRGVADIVGVAALILIAGCSSAPQPQERSPNVEVTKMGSARYFPGEPPYAVGVIPGARIHDAQRNRDVVVTIEYPTRGGAYPVIIFSHAYGSSKEAYLALTEYWVGHGYVCIKPSHADAGAVREAFVQRPGAMQGRGEGRQRESRRSGTAGTEVVRQPPQPAPEAQFQSQTSADWQNRTRDVIVILDSLGELEQKYPELAGKMDHSKIGVGGDSYGAFTTMLLGGMTSFKATPPLHPADPRVRAGLAISPQGVGDAFGLTPESWREVRIPMMYMTGSADRGLGENGDPQWRHDPFAYSPAGDKYFISFLGARHSSFAGNSGPISDQEIPRNTRAPQVDPRGNTVNTPQVTRGGVSGVQGTRRIIGSVQLLSIAFWDTYLKNNADAREYLTSDAFRSLNGSGMAVERK